MTFLTAVLPGLRDLRTPLAVGAIWCFAGWLALPLAPKSWVESPLVERLNALVSSMPAVAVIPLIGFAIYLLGLLLEPLGRGVSTLWPILLFGPGALAGALVVPLLVVGLVIRTYGLVLVPVLAILLWYYSRPHSLRHRLAYRLALRGSLIGAHFADALAAFRSAILRFTNPNFLAQEQFVADRIEVLAQLDRSCLARLMEMLKPRRLQVLARRISSGGFPAPPSQIAPLLTSTNLSERDTAALREFIQQRFDNDRRIRALVIDSHADLGSIRTAIQLDIERALALLRAHHKDAYDDLDRIANEGHFRTGIALPMSAALSLGLNQGIGVEPFWALALGLIPLTILTARGARQRDESQHRLLSCVRADLCPLGDSVSSRHSLYWSAPSSNAAAIIAALSGVRRRGSELARRILVRNQESQERKSENRQPPPPV